MSSKMQNTNLKIKKNIDNPRQLWIIINSKLGKNIEKTDCLKARIRVREFVREVREVRETIREVHENVREHNEKSRENRVRSFPKAVLGLVELFLYTYSAYYCFSTINI